MTQTPTSLGPYTISREIGRGGMGVVYLAHDTRLGRAVAIKALPEHLAQDPDRLARFEREARTLASLTHPNVAGIYGVETYGGAKYLVLEYVEGETLAERLDRGPLPVDEAVELALQIAAGVEAAHDAGVVHRDLKPANIKITPEGKVKVLDFGLAKSSEAASSSSHVLSASPTLTSPAALNSPTIPGAIMGTAPYMSPEQARGRAVDKRSDIWSFGIVLYEMLTGASPFHGETVSDSIGAILHKDVDRALLPPNTPQAVRRVLDRCLVRDKHHRLQAIGDARIDLELAGSEPAAAGARAATSVRRWALVALVALLAGILGFALHRAVAPPGPSEGPLFVSIPIGKNPRLEGYGAFALSPATRTIAYVSSDSGDTSDAPPTVIYVRDLHSSMPRRLAGTEHARHLGISPDGSQIAFTWFDPDSDREEVRRIGVDGGPVLTVYADRYGRDFDMSVGPLWISDDEVLALSADSSNLYRVSIAGGEPAVFATPSKEGGWIRNRPTSRLDERSVIMTRSRISTESIDSSLFRLDLETGEIALMLENARNGSLLPDGRLLFIRDNTLCLTAFDRGSGRATGAVTPIVSGLLEGSSYSVSPRGDLCTVSGVGEHRTTRLMSIDRTGLSKPLIPAERDFNGSVSVSNDGRQIALCVMSPNSGPPRAHIVDIDTGFIRPVYPDWDVTTSQGWSPDGRLAFGHWLSATHAELALIDPFTPTSVATLLTEADRAGYQSAPTFTPDGRSMLFTYRPEDGQAESGIYMIDLQSAEADRRAVAVIATSAEEGSPALSPDGRWLAYVTDASGKRQVMLRPFDAANPDPRARVHPVSFDGGHSPFWARDGSELFFLGLEPQHLMGVRIAAEPTLAISAPALVLDAAAIHRRETFGSRGMDIMPGGETFVYIEDPASGEPPASLDLTLNWFEELAKIRR